MGEQASRASDETRPWVVLKFGGTSVASASNWAQITRRIEQLLPERRVWLVVSALSQVSNRLEAAIAEALLDRPNDAFDWIRTRHEELAAEIGLEEDAVRPVRALLKELDRLLEGIRMTREASPRLRARVMSFGELASTYLGMATLQHRGIAAARVDARNLLRSSISAGSSPTDRFLAADVPPRAGRAEAEERAGGSPVVITQGFIASTPRGETCLLGRGGSDTSAALFAALLEADVLEIWTDVHGLFSTDPRQIPSARLIRHTSYREAQELAAMGAKVLHPRCLEPAAWAGVPVRIRNTLAPEAEGTLISSDAGDDPAVMAVVRRKGVTLLSISTLAMWGASGYLARVFAPFERLGISVDLVATSQSNVTVTLDHIPEGKDGEPFARLITELQSLGDISVIGSCAVVSVVGRRIRTVLHQLGPAFSAFEEHEVHMVSESSEDLNLSFVVDEADSGRLVANLHSRLLPRQGGNQLFGDSWEVLTGPRTRDSAELTTTSAPWWHARREELLQLTADGEARYVYDLQTIRRQGKRLTSGLPSVSQLYYAIKANSHQDVLRAVAAEGLGMECVSAAEIEWVREVLGDVVPILFTPNFCPVEEYARGFALGAEVTIDGPEVLVQNPTLFAGREIALRIDPGGGLGHHEKVVTAGAHAKFGHPIRDIDGLLAAAATVGAVVVGLHSHVGSGILQSDAWAPTAELLAEVAARIPTLRWVDVGGGLGVVERAGQVPLDLGRVDVSLTGISERLGDVALRMEPGRYLVSEAGVLLAPVTQVRMKGEVRFVGVATGMNSLLRPALYGAWHGIHNLTRLGQPNVGYQHIVGPICETGDILGRDRLLPSTEPGDILVVENCGAYGRVMSSNYNRREPAAEVVL